MNKTVIGLALTAAITAFGSANAQDANPEHSILVFKTPWCGCCQVWADRMIEAGYVVETRDMNDLSPIKSQAGVTEQLSACHTSVIGDGPAYVLEGHVPIEAVEMLMSEKPNVRGIAVPGMPRGSLGMGFDADAQYDVYAFTVGNGESPAVFLRMGQ
jgi:hypothetical protein